MTALQYSEYYLATTIYPGLSGVTYRETFFAAVGRNKRRVARRLKFHIKEQALRTRAVD